MGDSDAEDDEDETPESPGSSSSVIDDGEEIAETDVDGDDWVSDGAEEIIWLRGLGSLSCGGDSVLTSSALSERAVLGADRVLVMRSGCGFVVSSDALVSVESSPCSEDLVERKE